VQTAENSTQISQQNHTTLATTNKRASGLIIEQESELQWMILIYPHPRMMENYVVFFSHTPREFVLLDDGIRRWGVWSRRMILVFCRVSGSVFPCVVNRRLGRSELSNVPCHWMIEDFGPFAGEAIRA